MTVSRSVMSKIATWAITLLLVAGSIVTIGAQQPTRPLASADSTYRGIASPILGGSTT